MSRRKENKEKMNFKNAQPLKFFRIIKNGSLFMFEFWIIYFMMHVGECVVNGI